MKKTLILTAYCVSYFLFLNAQKVDYSVAIVPEEAGTEFVQISTLNDYVCMPEVKRTSRGISWYTNRILGVSPDGEKLAFLSQRNNTSNIFIKDINGKGGSVQRTKKQFVLDFSYSPDGKYICFSEKSGRVVQIFQTDSNNGYVCRQITSGALDYSAIYSNDMKRIFFARQEKDGISIWSYDIQQNYLSTYSGGLNPYPQINSSVYWCTRINGAGKSEIWKVDYETGTEECIVSDANRSFTTPMISPDGNWILLEGESIITSNNFTYRNVDVYVCKTDGTDLSQLTFHAADDMSPVWSKDGQYIYFISQRGSQDGIANIWRMPFIFK